MAQIPAVRIDAAEAWYRERTGRVGCPQHSLRGTYSQRPTWKR